MATHQVRSIDVPGLFALALDAREAGVMKIQNRVFAVLLKAAFDNHPHLQLALYTNDRFGELDQEARRDLAAIRHTVSNRTLRAPLRLLTKGALARFMTTVGDDDMFDIEYGRGYRGRKQPTQAQILQLEARFRAFAIPVPKDVIEGLFDREPVPA